jgi:hypothetical protein
MSEDHATLAEIIAIHKSLFGGWKMMADEQGEASEDADEAETDDAVESTGDNDDEADPEGADALGDPGKKALDAMKARMRNEQAKRRIAEQKAKDAQDALAKAQGEDEAAAQRRKVESDALAKANQRIVKAEVRAAAKGVLADPEDALVFLNLDSIEVGEDGDVDADDIAQQVADLVAKRPYLAAQRDPGKGTFDSGRGKASQKRAILTEAEYNALPSAERRQARKDGRVNKLLGIS